MNQQINEALKNIVDLHIWIEDVFTNPNAQDSLKKLLSSFDQNFKMITIQGHCISLAEVSSLFRENIGKKSAFKITISNVIPLFEAQNHYWIQYQEHQQFDQLHTLRISTVCIKIEDDQCYWVYLHETPVQLT
ncbi:hypothetical protein KTI96_08035 [Acinetobacter bereziniae]|uniref:hypothetical protein n=1 Tax=Acinetobacter bereziniae TaxID=106648 RepID=UPI0021CD903C|nr:hypothetical protein [Acinetobacter bereziniae]MCU4537113.1 hypothetical protein [Acinetobacter bereziniae]